MLEWTVTIVWKTNGGFGTVGAPHTIKCEDFQLKEGALVLPGAELEGRRVGQMGIPLDQILYWFAARERRGF
jgi:hypothetical protein